MILVRFGSQNLTLDAASAVQVFQHRYSGGICISGFYTLE